MDNREKTVTLWTLQHEEAFKKFQQTGFLLANNNYLCCEEDVDFCNAYNWIAQQMKERVGDPPQADIQYPIWAWYQWEGRRKRMDLRCSGYAKRGTKMVQLEIEVPKKDILLSDFDMWHFVISNCYIPKNIDDETWCEEPSEIRKSWTKVFELENLVKAGFSEKEHQSIQATLWQVSIDQVKKVKHFVAK